MPRERIHHGEMYVLKPADNTVLAEGPQAIFLGWDRVPYKGGPVEPPEQLHTDPSLDLSWNKDGGWVQISIDMERAQWLDNAEDLSKDESVVARAIYTDALNRGEINNLIRNLRRARDAAFGADE